MAKAPEMEDPCTISGCILMDLAFNNKLFVPHSGFRDGSVDELILVNGIPVIRGWFHVDGEFGPPCGARIFAGDTLVDIDFSAWHPRNDNKQEAAKILFEIRGRNELKPNYLHQYEVKIVLFDDHQSYVSLDVPNEKQNIILNYKDKKLFYSKIQNFSTRIRHPFTLIGQAKIFFSENSDDPLLQAAAIVVVGYKILENPADNLKITEWFNSNISNVIEKLSKPTSHIEYRWLLSATLIESYISFPKFQADVSRYLDNLQRVYILREQIKNYAPQATNMLKLTFLLGSVLWVSGNKDQGISVLKSATETLKYASQSWPFDSYHSAAEYVASAQITRACLVRAEKLLSLDTGKIRDDSYNLSQIYDFQCLGLPLFEFVKSGAL